MIVVEVVVVDPGAGSSVSSVSSVSSSAADASRNSRAAGVMVDRYASATEVSGSGSNRTQSWEPAASWTSISGSVMLYAAQTRSLLQRSASSIVSPRGEHPSVPHSSNRTDSRPPTSGPVGSADRNQMSTRGEPWMWSSCASARNS